MSATDSNQNKFNILISAIANSFPGYKLIRKENHWNVYFENIDDPCLGFYICPDNYRGKIEISTRYYKDNKVTRETEIYRNNGYISSISIGFSIDRNPEDIVKGIYKRFMPDFLEIYKIVKEKWLAEDNYKNGRENATREIYKALEIEMDKIERYNGELRCEFSPYHSKNDKLKKIISSIYVSSGDLIQIKTDYLPLEKGLKLIEAIKNL